MQAVGQSSVNASAGQPPGVRDLVAVLEKLDRRRQVFKLEYYKPYPYQLRFHNAEGHLTPGKPAEQRLLCAANKVGKTTCAADEIAMHLTGRYPEWFKGTRFSHPVEVLASGVTNDSVRDIGQRELFGDPTDPQALGTGTVPIDCIGKIRGKAGIQNGFDSVRVKHVSGRWSTVFFRAYEQGWKKFQGIAFHVAWPDEEPPEEIWSQLIRATIAKPGAIIMCTMTPEEGMTKVVSGFMNDLQRGQAIIGATWDDAPHLTPEVKAQRLAAFSPHERDMRSKGIPLAGAGLVFPTPDDAIMVAPFEIPRHWPQIVGIDFGWDHPFAASKLAWDRDSDTVYVIAEYRESRALPAIHAAAISAWGDWVPVAWPHDGLNAEKGTGDELIELYRRAKVNLLPDKATNPPTPGQSEGEGGNSVEAPVLEMVTRMETGRWKVFSSCPKWFEEKRMYHRDLRGKLVKQMDDLISSSRYAYMMLRHARTMSVLPARRLGGRAGLRNW